MRRRNPFFAPPALQYGGAGFPRPAKILTNPLPRAGRRRNIDFPQDEREEEARLAAELFMRFQEEGLPGDVYDIFGPFSPTEFVILAVSKLDEIIGNTGDRRLANQQLALLIVLFQDKFPGVPVGLLLGTAFAVYENHGMQPPSPAEVKGTPPMFGNPPPAYRPGEQVRVPRTGGGVSLGTILTVIDADPADEPRYMVIVDTPLGPRRKRVRESALDLVNEVFEQSTVLFNPIQSGPRVERTQSVPREEPVKRVYCDECGAITENLKPLCSSCVLSMPYVSDLRDRLDSPVARAREDILVLLSEQEALEAQGLLSEQEALEAQGLAEWQLIQRLSVWGRATVKAALADLRRSGRLSTKLRKTKLNKQGELVYRLKRARNPTWDPLFCEVCGANTSKRKPLCSECVTSMPYAHGLRDLLESPVTRAQEDILTILSNRGFSTERDLLKKLGEAWGSANVKSALEELRRSGRLVSERTERGFLFYRLAESNNPGGTPPVRNPGVMPPVMIPQVRFLDADPRLGAQPLQLLNTPFSNPPTHFGRARRAAALRGRLPRQALPNPQSSIRIVGTSYDKGHDHVAYVDNYGNGFTTTDKDHRHPVNDGVVEEVNGHTHELLESFTYRSLPNPGVPRRYAPTYQQLINSALPNPGSSS